MEEKINDFHPAQLYLFLNGKKYDANELIRIILVDLVLKKTLKYEKIKRRPSAKSRTRTYKYFYRGDNYDVYSPFKYEEVFLKPLKNTVNKTLITNYKKILRQENQGLIIQDEVFNSISNKGIVKKHFLNVINRQFVLTKRGKELHQKFTNELAAIKQLISNKSDNELLKEKIVAIGNNIILLEEFDEYFVKEFTQLFKDTDFSSSNVPIWSACGFDTFSFSDLDSIGGSLGCSSGSSGCGSGCSGCGGCGGCGS